MSIQNFKIKINTGPNTNPLPATLDGVIKQLEAMGLESGVALAVIKKAKSLPPGTLDHFLNNIHTYVANLTRDIHGKI